MESLGHVGHRAAIHNFFNIDGGNSAGEVGTLLRAVAHSHEFVEHFGGGLEIDVHAVGGGNVDRLIADIADSELSAGLNTDSKVAVDIGSGSIA